MIILKLNKKNSKEIVQESARAIKKGKILICPTDTVYGLVCDFFNKKAVARMYKIKKRPRSKLFPVFVKNIKMAKKIVKINPEQEGFLKKAWPGAVTVVIEKKKSAVRLPKYKFIIDLINNVGQPLAETSANISGKPGSTRIKEVMKQFKNSKYKPDLIIDAGNLKKSRPSVVVDLTIFPPKILRP